MGIVDEETIKQITTLLKQHPKGLMISDFSTQMKINRNIMSKYLDILLMSGQVEMEIRGNAKIFSLSRRIPLSNMFEFSSDYVIVLDNKGKILWVNTPVLSLLGKNPGVFAGRSLREIDDPFFTSLANRENPETGDHSSEICCKLNAEMKYFRIKQTSAVLADGSTGSILTCADITAERIFQQRVELSETRFRAIVEDQTEFVTRFLPDGSLTFVNRSYSRYMGKEPVDLVGQPHIPCMMNEVIPLLQQRFPNPDPNNLVTTIQCRVMNPVGNIRWQQWTVRALSNEMGEITEYQSVGRDITELHEAEESTREHITDMEFLSRKAREFLELPLGADIYNVISFGLRELLPEATITVSSYDPRTGAITIRNFWSEEVGILFRTLTGEDLIGKEFIVSDPDAVAGMKVGRIRRVPGDIYYAMFGLIPMAICQQIEQEFLMGSDKFAIGLVSRDRLLGTILIVPRNGQALTHQNLIETFLQQASIALAQRIDADALKQSEARFRAIVEDQTEFVTRFLPDGTLTFVNAPLCGAINKDPIDLLGRSFFTMIPEDDRLIVEASLKSLTVEHPKVTIEHRIPGTEGGIRWFQWTNRAIFNDHGHVMEYDGIGRDITELHKASARIRKHPADITFLSRNAKALTGIQTADEIFSFTAKNIRSIIPDALVGVCSYTPVASELMFRCIEGNPNDLGVLNHEVRQNLAGAAFTFEADPEKLSLFSSKRLVMGHGHLGLFFRSLSPDICARTAERLNFGRFYMMGLPSLDGSIDTVLIQLKGGMDLHNPELIEAAINQAGIALVHTQKGHV